MNLRIADELSLPLDLVTQTLAILAKRRAGKSYTARCAVEQLLAAEQQVVIVDPKGDHWGIRSSANGRKAGLPMVILGGEHGDVPLEVGSGEVVAKLVVEECVSVLLDLSSFRKREVAVFATAFMENLYRLKARERYRTPMMLVIDEADAIAPQKPYKGEERMLGAAEDIVRRGGQRGIGCTLVTQRSAVLNKNVLTQCEMIVCLRTIAPQDLAALNAWVDVHGTPEQRATLMESLPSLPIGDAWFWSPGWPTAKGIFKRVHVSRIQTFDSGATPKPGQSRVIPKNLADVNLSVLRRQMKDTIERAKAEDPKELRRQISALKCDLVAARTAESTSQEGKTIYLVKPQDRRSLVAAVKKADAASARANGLAANLRQATEGLENAAHDITDAASKVGDALQGSPPSPAPIKPLRVEYVPPKLVPLIPMSKQVEPAPRDGLPRAEQRILDALAWFEVIGRPEIRQRAVASVAGYSYSASSFRTPRSSLRTKGMVQYLQGKRMALTEHGAGLARYPVRPQSNEEVHAHVMQKLGKAERQILMVLLDVYPKPMPSQQLADLAGYAVGSSSFRTPRSRLKTLGLIDYPDAGHCVANDVLFPSPGHARL